MIKELLPLSPNDYGDKDVFKNVNITAGILTISSRICMLNP